MKANLLATVCFGALMLPGLLGAAVQSKTEKQESAQPASAPKAKSKAARPMKQTPFGPVEAKAETPRPARRISDDGLVSAEPQGDVVVFRRKTPFGDQVWKKKKSELTEEEREILARAQPAGQEPAAEPEAAGSEASPSGSSKPKR